MNDFTFQNTTKVFFGKNQLHHLHEEILKNGDSVLLVYGGGSIKKIGLYDKVLTELKENGISVYELGGIEPNPRHTTVNKGVQICREKNVQTILAVGGGSVIDASKAISATVNAATDDFWSLVEGKVSWKDTIPVIAIPTIASTGSEMDKSCVIANVSLKVKKGIAGDKLRPVAAFLNPENTYSVSRKQTACGGFDIFAHLFDMNYFVNSEKYPLQYNVVEALIKTVVEQLPVAIEDGNNEAARSGLLWAASWALNSFCTSGFHTQASLHTLEQFSSVYDMTHGLALAILAPKWMKYLMDHDCTVAKDFERFGLNVMKIQNQNDCIKNAYEAIAVFQTYIVEQLHLPETFHEAGLENIDIEELLDHALKGADCLPKAYRVLTREDMKHIYEMCL